jgi:methyl-accepting chemotaxis protein
MQLLLSGGIGDDYIRSSRHLNSRQAELGLTPRTRIFLGTLILKAALNAFARKTRLSGNAVAKRGRVVAQAIAFDVATSFTLYQDAEATAAERRRIRVAEAIGEFEPTLRTLVNSVMGTSDALLQKSADLARGAEATSQRMESASHSSVQMARSIESTSQSANALSTSIGEIVRQSEASHDMAQRAARDAETSMVLVESLFQACQQIGSVVDVISRIAQQTNLLALKCFDRGSPSWHGRARIWRRSN